MLLLYINNNHYQLLYFFENLEEDINNIEKMKSNIIINIKINKSKNGQKESNKFYIAKSINIKYDGIQIINMIDNNNNIIQENNSFIINHENIMEYRGNNKKKILCKYEINNNNIEYKKFKSKDNIDSNKSKKLTENKKKIIRLIIL